RELLKQTADKIGSGYDSQGHSDTFGHGRVNASAALQALSAGAGPSVPATGTTVPTVTAPASVLRSGPAPALQVNPRPNSFYAVELATVPELLAASRSADRTPSNFFATWQTSSLLSAPLFQLPAAAWNALKPANRVYFRVVTSSSQSS